ncbi:MAG: 2-oxo acid dehydrogenase subunit E2 [Acidobacteria bacterium]|jgi:pyruvate dehydrogenase E2 component (dihydrolipoamide acetyltransferase)|nr:2-oxo acid dehydrogenase subunit E2 [Acidobacteriota bacterium]
MATEVVMPQMGESIAEGTIVRWIKKVGDAVDKDEPLFEISTDKVDAEIPSPGAGVLLEIAVKEGETVPVNSVVALIGVAGESTAASDIAVAAPDTSAAATEVAPAAVATSAAAASDAPQAETGPGPESANDLETRLRTKSSPVVRNIAKEHGVDLSQLNGTGISGRVTKKDILAFVESGAAAQPSAGTAATPVPAAASIQAFAPGENVRIEPMGIMRKKIADHMVMSLRTSPHVYSAYEVDFSRIDEIRKKKKTEYEAAGAKLTYTAFLAKATVDTIREFPFSNASIDGDNIIYKRDINLGIAVALEQGLIVPVIKKADEKNMLGICRAIQDLAGRARSKKLLPDEVQGGTFTITNPGIFGAVFGLPVISQPQVAILGVGSVDKRVVVVDDMIAIRPMCHLTLGYDHRLIDGADAGRFLQALKERLQDFDMSWV